MAEGQTEIQGGESLKNNVINLEAAKEKRLSRKIKGYKDPPKYVKIISAFLKRHPLPPLTEESAQRTEPLPPVEPATHRIQAEQTGNTTQAKDAVTAPSAPDTTDRITELRAVREKLRSEQKERLGERRNWHEIAQANGWGTNPDSPNDGFYVDRIVEYAQQLGLDPLTLTPAERRELTTHGDIIIERARKLGLDPRRLTPQARDDLRSWGRIPTEEERKQAAEIAEQYSVKPLTPKEWSERMSQLIRQRQAHRSNAHAMPLSEFFKQVEPNLKERYTLADLIFDLLSVALKKLTRRPAKQPEK